MTILAFELQLKEMLKWDTSFLTDEEFDFIMEQVSYMSDRDRLFYFNILKKLSSVDYE
jgi:hypothetical protein